MELPTDLVHHLSVRLGLDPRQAVRVVEELLAYFGEPAETFVVRRHHELQRQGLRNPAIFARIQAELEERRFPAPRLSARQLRRWIYG